MASVPLETRRTPRYAARCAAEVSFGAGRWMGLTDDLGAGGCRIVARIALRPGEAVSLKLRYAGVGFALDVVGTVAWSTPRPPWRTGVAFARGQEQKARRFVRAVQSAAPDLAVQAASGGLRAPPPARHLAPVRPHRTPVEPSASHVHSLVLAARSQAEAGNLEDAARNLRAALALAPGDARVLAELKRLGVQPE